MPRLLACPHCQSHALTTESQCPHCGGSLRARSGRLALTTAAVLMGLAPMGCEKGTGTTPPEDSGGIAEPEYGVPVTDGQDLPSDDTGGPDSGEPTSDAPDAPADPHDNPDFAAEYGVPATDIQDVAPMYGVADSDSFPEKQ